MTAIVKQNPHICFGAVGVYPEELNALQKAFYCTESGLLSDWKSVKNTSLCGSRWLINIMSYINKTLDVLPSTRLLGFEGDRGLSFIHY